MTIFHVLIFVVFWSCLNLNVAAGWSSLWLEDVLALIVFIMGDQGYVNPPTSLELSQVWF